MLKQTGDCFLLSGNQVIRIWIELGIWEYYLKRVAEGRIWQALICIIQISEYRMEYNHTTGNQEQ